MKELQKAYAVQNESCNWYIIPIGMKDEFYIDVSNDDMVCSGDFDDKYSKYMTGGDVNLTQIWAEL